MSYTPPLPPYSTMFPPPPYFSSQNSLSNQTRPGSLNNLANLGSRPFDLINLAHQARNAPNPFYDRSLANIQARLNLANQARHNLATPPPPSYSTMFQARPGSLHNLATPPPPSYSTMYYRPGSTITLNDMGSRPFDLINLIRARRDEGYDSESESDSDDD